ncbi:MAG: hypothetical protein ACRDRK_06965 [Pseudonocardia sp.]
MARGIGPTIGERIVTLRGKRLTQTALAARADVSVDWAGRLDELGRLLPDHPDARHRAR